MDNAFSETDFKKIEISPRGENILAPNGNHHPAVQTRVGLKLIRESGMNESSYSLGVRWASYPA